MRHASRVHQGDARGKQLTAAARHWLQVQFLNAANPAPAVVAATVLASAPLNASGIKSGAPMDLTGLYTTPVIITDTTRSTVSNVGCRVAVILLDHDLSLLYPCWPSVVLTSISVLQPVSQVVSPSEYSAGYTAVTTKFPSGREQFTTFYPCAAFSSDCLLTAHMYFAWGMHGIIPGSRDSLFSVQVSL
jgi:hypothetical protein